MDSQNLWYCRLILSKNFLEYMSDTIENHGLLNLSRCNSNCYTAVVLNDFEAAFVVER